MSLTKLSDCNGTVCCKMWRGMIPLCQNVWLYEIKCVKLQIQKWE